MSEGGGGGGVGISKMDLAKEAAFRAVKLLQPQDEVGIVAFDGSAYVVAPRKPLRDQPNIAALIGTLQSGGGTEIRAGLEEALNQQAGSGAKVRHIILVTDGQSANNFADLVKKMNDAGITLSVIGVGQGVASYLPQLAADGNGRYYFAADPSQLPEIFLQETRLALRSYFIEGDIGPRFGAATPITEGLQGVPNLLGYVGTTAKPTAQTGLVSPEGDPLLAQWQYGLGRVVAWTSDLSQQLAADWRNAEAYGPFWNQAVRWTLAAAVSPYYRVTATPDGHDIILAVDAFDASGQAVNLTETRGVLRTPGGQAVNLALPQTAPGRYEVRLAAPESGAYSLELRQTRNGQAIADTAGFSVPYPAELRGPTVGDSILGALADRTGGRVLDSPQRIFDRTVLTATPRFAAIWQPFAALALPLFLLDIAIRLGYAITSGSVLRRVLPR